jgi:hypothetical protein
MSLRQAFVAAAFATVVLTPPLAAQGLDRETERVIKALRLKDDDPRGAFLKGDVKASTTGTFPKQDIGEDVGFTFDVVQVIGPDAALVRPVYRLRNARARGPLYRIEGWPTAGVVDGKPIQLSGRFKVGTKTYKTTSGGSKTVFLLEPAKE